MAPIAKNTIPTRISIDLKTIDVKADKLAKYFKNCEMDLRDFGQRFVNYQVDYKSLEQTFRNKKYKESLSKLVDNIYFTRFVQTTAELQKQGILDPLDLSNLLPGAIDDFGSKFDAFAATNTDPENLILQIFGIKPYKELIIDIFTPEEYETYQNNLSANYDVERLSFILQKLENLTQLHISQLVPAAIEGKNYITELYVQQILPDPASPDPGLLSTVPNIQNAINLFDLLREQGFNESLFTKQLFNDTLKLIEPNIYNNISDALSGALDNSILEKAKIKIINFILKNEIKAVLENKIALAANLNGLRSKYSFYNFVEETFDEIKKVPPQNLIFRLTYLKETFGTINQINLNSLLDNKIEFNNLTKASLNILSPFGNSEVKNNRFVAFITAADLNKSPTPVEFFQPTVLSILSDIDYIDHNIYEINPVYCPPQETLSSHAQSNQGLYLENEVLEKAVFRGRELVESNSKAFHYYNFPDFYFIPNALEGPSAFYEVFDRKLSPQLNSSLIIQNSKFYYRGANDTPAAIISRDKNLALLYKNARLNNGFYGLVQATADSFSDPYQIQSMIARIERLGSNAVKEINSIVLAKKNIACLLSEFAECFLPKIGNCKDVLRGFRFADLENLVRSAFPQSAYASLYEIIDIFKEQEIKDAREKEILSEIKRLENAIKNNPRKLFVFNQLDNRLQPDVAFGLANIEIGNPINISLEQQLEDKLEEYRNFKLGKEQLPETKQEEELKIDKFLQLLEENGIDLGVLCDLGKLINDLLKISFTFGNFSLPSLPSIDLFQEVKLSLDLSIIEIILQTIIAFIKKILEELTTCGGWKDLLEGALTGDAEGLTGAAAAALGDIARGEFDLDKFVEKNPQVDPNTYNKEINNIVNALANSVTGETNLYTNLSVIPNTINSAKITIRNLENIAKGIEKLNKQPETDIVSRNSISSAVTEKEISVAVKNLISELAGVLTPQEYIGLITGKALNSTLLKVVNHISTNRQEISYLANINIINRLFNKIAEISGLELMREELFAAASTYAGAGGILIDKFCVDENIRSFNDITTPAGTSVGQSGVAQNVEQLFADRQRFRDLINDLLACSPDKIKSLIDENVFKPILMGILPSGKPISVLDEANKKHVDSSLKKIQKKIKSSSNSFYSSLTLKKPYIKEIQKMLPGQGEDGGEYENPEFKDEINKGGRELEDNQPVVEGDILRIEKEKIIYCGIFTENMKISAETFNVATTDDSITLSIEGKKGYTSEKVQNYLSTTGSMNSGNRIPSVSDAVLNMLNRWKIESIMTEEENKFNVYKGLAESPAYSYVTKRESNLDINGADEVIKESINRISVSEPETILINNYLQNIKSNYFNILYNKIIDSILNDGLLKDLENIKPEEIEQNILDAIGNFFDISGLFSTESPIGIDSELKDKVLKYINFSPNPSNDQKNKNADPSLYGKLEITDLIGKILSKRKSEILDLKSLEEILKDEDNTLYLSMIDGFYMSLIRTICIETCLRNLFVFRTFNFTEDYLNNLMLQTLLSDKLYTEITSFTTQINLNSFLIFAHEHIEYLHNFVLKDGLYVNGKNLLSETEQVKKEITALKQDIEILLSYVNKIEVDFTLDIEFRNSIENYKKCLKDEVEVRQIKLTKLHLRNLIHNELGIILKKLTYITSTNDKVLSEIGEQCSRGADLSADNIILDMLFKDIFDVSWIVDWEFTSLESGKEKIAFEPAEIIEQQNNKMNKRVFVEHFIYVPLIKEEYSSERQIQKEEKLYGICSLKQFQNLISHAFIAPYHAENIINMFEGNIKYGARVVYLPNVEFNKSGRIWELTYEPNNSVRYYDLDKSFLENIKEHNGKNIIYKKNNITSEYEQIYEIKNIRIDEIEELINLYEKTHFIPWIDNISYSDSDGPSGIRLSFTECYPIVTETVNIPQDYKTLAELFNFIETLKNQSTNTLIKDIKQKIKCNEDYTKLNKIFTLDQSMFNLLSFSSLEILSSEQFTTPFSNIRFNILHEILTKIKAIYTDELGDDFLETLSSLDFFKNFNADAIIKAAIKAAVHVLAYYCQMTDPNIALSMIYRNAVKIVFGLASQVGSIVGQPLPSEPPLPLNLLLPYSLPLQRPVNIFGLIPVGIGTGPPITIPGLILLGAELLLINLEFADNIDSNLNNENIKEQLRKLCFDIYGYKKYGVE